MKRKKQPKRTAAQRDYARRLRRVRAAMNGLYTSAAELEASLMDWGEDYGKAGPIKRRDQKDLAGELVEVRDMLDGAEDYL